VQDGGGLARRLFEQYGTSVGRYLQRFTGDLAGAEDLTQEVFLRIVRAGGVYQDRQSERAWVFRIARNVLLDSHRAQQRNRSIPLLLEPVAIAPQSTRANVREALSRIPVDEREAFLMREIGGLSYGEIAGATDSTVPAVRSRIYRARLALRDLLIPPAPLHAAVLRRHGDDE
jgi:RNA polymerase sigma factor (sigma-70 family)